MITEDYVSFETAKLLKEKGFNERLLTFYITDESKKDGCFQLMAFTDDKIDNNHSDHCYLAPTLQMAMKWLREVHDLHIMVNCVGKVNYDPIVQRFDGKDFEIEGVEVGTTRRINGKWENVRRGFKTYEQACEAAIKYCLENLINLI